MRTEKLWNDRWRGKSIKTYFPPRIQNDLLSLEEPNFPFSVTQNVYIWGDTGSGKTIYACQMLLRAAKMSYLHPDAELPRTFSFTSVPVLLQQLKQTFANPVLPSGERAEKKIIEFCQNVDYLILDDLGRCSISDWLYDVLYLIINHRYDHLKTTIITSNINVTELANVLGDDRISSRIVRMGEVFEKSHWYGAT